jgi:galactokinase
MERLALAFATIHGTVPNIWVRAPGQVDLMGSDTDHNQGHVLTMPIDRDTWIVACRRPDHLVCVQSLNIGQSTAFALERIAYDKILGWTNYVRGIAAVLQTELYALSGFDGLIHSTMPLDSGLGSWAALEVATAALFQTLGGWDIEPVQTAMLCQRAENEFVGVDCSIVDQYTSILGQAGHALLLDCRDLTSRSVLLPDGVQVVICDTQAKPALTGPESGERRAQCEAGTRILARTHPEVKALRDVTLEQFEQHEAELPELVAKRCRFVIEENVRAMQLADALSQDDRAAIGNLMAASYAGARDLYEIDSPETAAMMEAILRAPGVIGARQSGAGCGSSVMAVVERGSVEAFESHVLQSYAAATGIEPQVIPVNAAAGAGRLGM